MPNFLINDFGDPNSKISLLQPREVDDDHAKLATLLFDKLVVAHPFSEETRTPAAIRFGDPQPRSYFGANYGYLCDQRRLLEVVPGFDDTLLGYIENRQEYLERELGDYCLIHPGFLNPNHDRQPALSIGFLQEIVPPPGNVPLEDVLEFKERRRAELLAFWDLVYEVALDPTGLLVSQPEHILRTRLAARLAELEHVQGESWGGSLLRRCSIQIALPVTAIANLALHQLGLAALSGLALGVLSNVSFGIDMIPSRHPPGAQARAMTFVLDARRELQR